MSLDRARAITPQTKSDLLDDLAVIPVLYVVIGRGTPGTLGQQEHANDHGARRP